MMTFEQRELLHKHVVYDMAVKSLQQDYQKIEGLKMGKVYLPMLDKLLKDLSHDYYDSKRLLAKDKIKIVRWDKVDKNFSDLTVTTAGEDQVLTYANMALKTQVEKLLLSIQDNG